MASNEAKNEMSVMVLIDLSAICRKLAENSAVPEGLRAKAHHFVTEFNSLLPVPGEGTAHQHVQGEQLLVKIARFLPAYSKFMQFPRPYQSTDHQHKAACVP